MNPITCILNLLPALHVSAFVFFKKSKSLIESQKCKVSIGVLITGKSKHGSRLACFALYCYFFVTFFRMTGGEAATYRLRSILE